MQDSFYRKLDAMSLAVLDTVKIDDNSGYYITRINVPSNYRYKGVGRSLLCECIAAADVESIHLYLEIAPSDGMSYDELRSWYL